MVFYFSEKLLYINVITFRNINEISKKLEEQKNRALTAIDLFTPNGEALRAKLRDYCERLIIDDPINYVQKTEELLWRKAFYDIVSSAKKLKKVFILFCIDVFYTKTI